MRVVEFPAKVAGIQRNPDEAAIAAAAHLRPSSDQMETSHTSSSETPRSADAAAVASAHLGNIKDGRRRGHGPHKRHKKTFIMHFDGCLPDQVSK